MLLVTCHVLVVTVRMSCLQLEGLESRLRELDASNKELTDHKYRSEASIRELKAKLGTAEEVSCRFFAHLILCSPRLN